MKYSELVQLLIDNDMPPSNASKVAQQVMLDGITFKVCPDFVKINVGTIEVESHQPRDVPPTPMTTTIRLNGKDVTNCIGFAMSPINAKFNNDPISFELTVLPFEIPSFLHKDSLTYESEEQQSRYGH